jgi:hypothetical protein
MKLDLAVYMATQRRAERSAEKQERRDLGSAFVDVEGFGLAAGTAPVGKSTRNVRLRQVDIM